MSVYTIGYEKSTLCDFIATLQEANVQILVDIRDRAQSRRKGFSKTALSAALQDSGIEYLHLRELGDPKEGRDAARAGLMEKFREIFLNVLEQPPAQNALLQVQTLAQSSKICLMCYERNHHECHREMVADCLEEVLDTKTIHLGVPENAAAKFESRRMLHNSQGVAAQV